MKVCVLGAGGLLGHMLVRKLGTKHQVFGTTRERKSSDLPLARFIAQQSWIDRVDATQFDSVATLFAKTKFDVVINCVGLIKQRENQVTDQMMFRINGDFPHQLSELANKHGSKLIQISTDCVFSGQRGNYSETDTPDPVDAYGESKFRGEICDSKNLTLRTSHIGRELSTRKSFIEWVLSNKGKEVKGFSKAIYSGLTTIELARVIERILAKHRDLTGLFNVSSDPISKLEIINKLNSLLGLQMSVVSDESVHVDRSLNSEKLKLATGITAQSWDQMLAAFSEDQQTYV